MEERRNFALLQEQLEEYLGLILRESQDFHALQQDLEECNARKKSKKSRNQSETSFSRGHATQ